MQIRTASILVPLLLACGSVAAGAQIIRDPGELSVPADPASPIDALSPRRAQAEFERFHNLNLPSANVARPTNCDEQVGNICYWYNDKAPPAPAEPPVITAHRNMLISALDTAAIKDPTDRWITEQRVRYLEEAGRPDSALAAAKECKVGGWWCDMLTGFALHLLGRYAAADSAYSHMLAQMLPKDRCDWRSIDVMIDDDTRQQYRRFQCGDPAREAFENRVWFFARTLYSMNGNDSRTEHYARMTMAAMLRDAPGLVVSGTLDDDLELMMRFGWARGWAATTISNSNNSNFSMGFPHRYPSGGRGQTIREVTSYEPSPAYRYIPPGFVLNSPSMSDSSNWRLQLPPVIARYAPVYAKSLTPLEHQKAMFKRGDTALVVMAYDARVTKQLDGAKLTAALVVTPNDKPADYGKIVHDAPETGVLMAKAPWGGLLMSAEVYAPEKKAVARARYGINPPFAVGARVTLSDLLFYKPYGTFPSTVEEAAPHALPTERLMANDKLGVYWESYGTDPAGEKMKVSLTVVREVTEQAGFLKRQAEALKLVHEATPVVVGVEDLSARGTNVTPRALELDISTLKKGSYIVQLEIEVAGQYTVRAEHRIEIIGP